MLVICKFLIPNSIVYKINQKKINEFFIKNKFGFLPLALSPKNKFVLFYKNFFYFIFSSFFLTYLTHFKSIFHRSLFNYRIDIKLIGRGYKFFFLNSQKIEFKIGINTPIRVFFRAPLVFIKLKRCRYDTQIFQIKSENFLLLTSFISFLRRLKTPDSYKGKGLRFRKEKFKIKYRKKYGVF